MRDKINQIITIVLWIISILIWIENDWWYLAIGIFTLHLIEVFVIGVNVGKRARKTTIFSVIMTLIFGFTWWLPIQRRLGD